MDFIPPHDILAEKAFLGSMMLNAAAARDGITLVRSEMFYREPHARVFDTISELVVSGVTCDAISVADAIEPGFDKSYLLELVDSVALASNYKQYAAIIRDKYRLRSIINAADELKIAAYSDDDDLSGRLSHILYEMGDVLDDGSHREYNLISLVDERLSRGGEPEEFFSVPGFDGLHLFGGDLMVIGGRPGAGKTAFAVNLLLNWSETSPVRMYSYEMTERQLADRVISALTGISVEDIEAGVDESTVEMALSLMDESFVNKDFSVRVAAGMTNAELFADMYKFASRGGKVVCIDYIQLAADKTRAGLTPDVTMFSNKLRRVALDTGLLVVGVAQLNRQVEEREKIHLPMMSDIRESGTIEQDATQICMLTSVPNPRISSAGKAFIDSNINQNMVFSEDMLNGHTGNPDDDPVLVVADFIKVRQGKRRRWPFVFDGSCMRFTPLSRSRGIPTRQIPVDSRDACEMMELDV